VTSNWQLGNLKDFGKCVLKFQRLSDDQFYIDLTENIIHNNNPSHLTFWVFDSTHFALILAGDPVLDFKFYETCAISIIIKFENDRDNLYRFLITYGARSRDVYRSYPFYTILFTTDYPTSFKILDRREHNFAAETYFAKLIKDSKYQIELFYVCNYCRNTLIQIPKNTKLSSISIFFFKRLWTSLKFGVTFTYYYEFYLKCENPQSWREYFSACDYDFRQLAVLSTWLNITFAGKEHSFITASPGGF
jgi:hypothetical protein